MSEVYIEVTKKCLFGCPTCSSDATPDGEHLSFERIIEILERIPSPRRINITGGEPLYHPKIGEIIYYCLGICPDTRVYTNLIRHLIYNSHIVNEVKVEANVLLIPGDSVYIPKHCDLHILKLVDQGRAKGLKQMRTTVSHNFERDETHDCKNCDNIYIRADGRIARSPCKKELIVKKSEVKTDEL